MCKSTPDIYIFHHFPRSWEFQHRQTWLWPCKSITPSLPLVSFVPLQNTCRTTATSFWSHLCGWVPTNPCDDILPRNLPVAAFSSSVLVGLTEMWKMWEVDLQTLDGCCMHGCFQSSPSRLLVVLYGILLQFGRLPLPSNWLSGGAISVATNFQAWFWLVPRCCLGHLWQSDLIE